MIDKEIKLDFERSERIGFGEAIFCADKSSAQISRILNKAHDSGLAMLITRLEPKKHDRLESEHKNLIDYDPVSETGFFHAHLEPAQPASVAIVTAGTSDARVAYEAARTLEFNGINSDVVFDVGVAGLWRLTEKIDEIKSYPIVIAVAGMDAALISVLGGLVPGLLIAVPTSTGYGAAHDGETALAASLVSCAPGVVVCNIDNGYGAACAAIRAIQAANLMYKEN